jgi:Acetyltransferase (GNAT) domain
MSLQLRQCLDDTNWDQFVEDSPQGSIFCSSGFLAALGESFERYFIVEANVPLAAAVLLMRDGIPLPAPYPFSCYHGVMFSRYVDELPLHRGVPERLRLVDFLLAELSKRYSRLSFCLHYQFPDLRSFLWFNYHEPQNGKFMVEVHYTGLLSLPKSETNEEYLRRVRELRRREYLRAVREGVVVECSNDIDLLDRLHELTFKRQSISRSEDEVRLVRSIARQAVSRRFGKLLVARTATGEAASAYLFLLDRKCGYYLFGANHPDLRKTAASSYLMFHVFDTLRSEGIHYVDFCGINSPNRGDFKTSFNARPTPYFVVNWIRP